jgi:hypothetical protein
MPALHDPDLTPRNGSTTLFSGISFRFRQFNIAAGEGRKRPRRRERNDSASRALSQLGREVTFAPTPKLDRIGP